MFDINRPFDSKHYKPFEWNPDEISNKIFSCSYTTTSRGGFALISQRQLTSHQLSFVTEENTYWLSNETLKTWPGCGTLSRHNLVLCQLPNEVMETSAPGMQALYKAYLREIVLAQLAWIARWIAILMDHAAQRIVGASTLLSIPSVRLRIGQVMQHHALLRQCLTQPNWSTQQAKREIESMMDALIKTTGGRSMLQYGLVEMNSIFTVVNTIYLEIRHDKI